MTDNTEEHYQYAVRLNITGIWWPSREAAEKQLAITKEKMGNSVGLALIRRPIGKEETVK